MPIEYGNANYLAHNGLFEEKITDILNIYKPQITKIISAIPNL